MTSKTCTLNLKLTGSLNEEFRGGGTHLKHPTEKKNMYKKFNWKILKDKTGGTGRMERQNETCFEKSRM
jgi:hypothetical protein